MPLDAPLPKGPTCDRVFQPAIAAINQTTDGHAWRTRIVGSFGFDVDQGLDL